MKRATCAGPGVCQNRAQRCAGCQPFAPGVIDGPYPNDRQTRVLQRWALLTAILALVAFVAGYLS